MCPDTPASVAAAAAPRGPGASRVLRLKRRAEFQRVLAAGVWLRTAHFVLHRRDTPAGHALGALVPKRLARRAVTRNAIRRQIYAVGAVFLPHCPSGEYVVRLSRAFEPGAYPSAWSAPLRRAVRGELEALAQQALAATPA